ncbi:hypothetical protein CEE45_09070 [Candidatus Heimdallarchaeota archaeon B3_Heim]|nr:MAG: hypothetical protein CEE45_09070 [Candidatus Heimdallarchaeota archaeon B3_Heim]
MELTLEGEIITPIISRKTVFKVENCRAVILNPKRRYITKSHKERRIYPYSFIGYLGKIKVTYRCQTFPQVKNKLKELLSIEHIGRFWSEGLGKISWLAGWIGSQAKEHKKTQSSRVKIRKGLPHQLPEQIQRLIRYALLHDFVHTPRHKSKIYIELQVRDVEILKQHHENSDNVLIQTFQKYDRLAAMMTRKIRSPRTNRYTWESKSIVDFELLAHDIESLDNNVWKLYLYIYESKELQQLNESLNYGHSSLRNHLLLIANLIVQDFLRGSL